MSICGVRITLRGDIVFLFHAAVITFRAAPGGAYYRVRSVPVLL